MGLSSCNVRTRECYARLPCRTSWQFTSSANAAARFRNFLDGPLKAAPIALCAKSVWAMCLPNGLDVNVHLRVPDRSTHGLSPPASVAAVASPSSDFGPFHVQLDDHLPVLLHGRSSLHSEANFWGHGATCFKSVRGPGAREVPRAHTSAGTISFITTTTCASRWRRSGCGRVSMLAVRGHAHRRIDKVTIAGSRSAPVESSTASMCATAFGISCFHPGGGPRPATIQRAPAGWARRPRR